ncbi:MAG: tryptophanase [Tissierellia bacterium]|nr:tryptophanase [Tissierellia bacterium]
MAKYVPEPFRIKMVEKIKMTTREEREEAIRKAHYNLFNLRSRMVYIDLLTDSGTNAMSEWQWAGLVEGDEAYAGGESYYHLMDVAKDIFGYDMIQVVHQGRAAEKVVFPLLMGKGDYAISNMFFDTTRAHVEIAGARAIDCVTPSALDPTCKDDFKGNMDIEKLEKLLDEYGNKVKAVVMTVTNNSAGGQPVSMANLRAVSSLCKDRGVFLNLDAARFAENAYFIKMREPGFENHTLKEIIREMFSLVDGFTMSAKKDAIVNMGGLIGIKENQQLFEGVKANCISFEGFITYGGLSGRDLEALARGLEEGVEYEQLEYRYGQIKYLADLLEAEGIAFQSPAGGHGLFIDAKAFYPHIPYYHFPGQTLAIELYKEAGIRTCDIGSFMLGNDPDTKEQLKSQFEFTRLAIPRRVYTQSHMDLIRDAFVALKEKAASQKGYKITWEPPILRHFQAHLEEV